MAEADKERQKLEQDKADLKKKEDSMRARLQVEYDKKERERQQFFVKKHEELQRKFDILEAERRNWEEERERVKQTTMFDKVVTLDVGGDQVSHNPLHPHQVPRLHAGGNVQWETRLSTAGGRVLLHRQTR